MQLWHIRRLIHRRTTQDISEFTGLALDARRDRSTTPPGSRCLKASPQSTAACPPCASGSRLPRAPPRARRGAASSPRVAAALARAAAGKRWNAPRRGPPCARPPSPRAPPCSTSGAPPSSAPPSRARRRRAAGRGRRTPAGKFGARSAGNSTRAAGASGAGPHPPPSPEAAAARARSRLYLGCISAVSRLYLASSTEPRSSRSACHVPCGAPRAVSSAEAREGPRPSESMRPTRRVTCREGPGTTTSEQVHAEPRRRPRRVTSASPPPPRKLSRATAATCSGRPTARKESCGLDA